MAGGIGTHVGLQHSVRFGGTDWGVNASPMPPPRSTGGRGCGVACLGLVRCGPLRVVCVSGGVCVHSPASDGQMEVKKGRVGASPRAPLPPLFPWALTLQERTPALLVGRVSPRQAGAGTK